MIAKEFTESFLEFEYRNKMFCTKINNVYIWHYIRGELYCILLKMLNIFDGLMDDSHKKASSKVTCQEMIRKYITCNQFLAHKRDVLIIPHVRKYKDGEKYYKCIYTHLLDETLENSHYLLDMKSLENNYAILKSHNVLYCDLEAFKAIKRLNFQYESISKSEVNSMIIEPIEKYFNISINLEIRKQLMNLVRNKINERKYWIRYYNYMLKKISPQIVLIVVSYSLDRMVLCEEAKKRNIPVVELQHGAINSGHVTYNFYKKMKLPSFPDYIFTFGQFEKDRIIPVGYPELEKYLTIYKKERKFKKTILFISQGLEQIAEYARIMAENLDAEKYQVVFQLHPKEYFDWKKKLSNYLFHPNIEVVGSFEHTVYESLAQADWVVGCYSTVLYEAQMFNVKVAVLKFSLYYSVENLYKTGCALLVDSPRQLIDEIKLDSFEPNREVSMFEKNSLEKMKAGINDIMRCHSRQRKKEKE